jgi:hypothetical protein
MVAPHISRKTLRDMVHPAAPARRTFLPLPDQNMYLLHPQNGTLAI